ncbi:MAG: hypothetical protein J6B04_06135 [Clostridia bacterium]|nr:hypothetical protein [Clostridia bacterium]
MRLAKRLIFLIAAAIICLSLSSLNKKVCFNGATNNVFYCGNTSKTCKEVKLETPLCFALLLGENVCGESAEYEELNVNEFLDKVNGKIVFCERLLDSVNYYCKADLPYSVNLYGEEINLHICVKQSGIKVGTPIIFGGY